MRKTEHPHTQRHRPRSQQIRTWGKKGVTPSSPEARRTTHRRLRRPKFWSGRRVPQSRMFQKSVPLNLPPSPRNLLLPPLSPPPPTSPPPTGGNRPCHLACHLLSPGYPEASSPRQISERLASELAEPGARCCYDLFLDFSLSLCCSTAVASRPIDGALSLSSLSLSSVTQI